MLKEVQGSVGVARGEHRQVSREPSDHQALRDGPDALQAPFLILIWQKKGLPYLSSIHCKGGQK